MTKNDIAVKIAEKTGLRQGQVRQIVQMVLDDMIDCLVTEGNLELRNFGILSVATRRPRRARNPKTGEKVMVPERKTVRFKPGKVMKARIREAGVASRNGAKGE